MVGQASARRYIGNLDTIYVDFYVRLCKDIDEGSGCMAKKKYEKKYPDIIFHIEAGCVKLAWNDSEYRAYLNKNNGWGFQEMKLGSCNPEPLKKYIMEVRNNG